MTREAGLTGKKVLVVEDEFLIALDLEAELEQSGATVTCASTLSQAAGCLRRGVFDAAILDLNLEGETSYPIADYLREHDVPFLFHTALGERTVLTKRYPGVVVRNKPCDGTAVVRELERMISAA